MAALNDVPRLIGELRAKNPNGPTLICVGGLHGNEPAGVLALQRMFAKLSSCPDLLRGRFVGLAGNLQALAAGRRFLDDDLNRIWWPKRLERIRRSTDGLSRDEMELAELDARLVEFQQSATGRLWFVDLHTTSGDGPAFATFEDTLPNRRFAKAFPVPHVMGLEEEIVATLANHLSAEGVTTVGFESGQHDDPGSVDRAEAAAWIALETCGVLPRGSRREVAAARKLLGEHNGALPQIVEVRYRHAVRGGDGFRMRPGLSGFQSVRAGEPIADCDGKPVAAPESGLLLMPLYQDQGDDGFFVIRRVNPLWLSVSAALRRLRLERYLHWFPGVERHPEYPRGFIVDRRRARWFALQIFHLLGFQRLGDPGRSMVFLRRSHDFRAGS